MVKGVKVKQRNEGPGVTLLFRVATVDNRTSTKLLLHAKKKVHWVSMKKASLNGAILPTVYHSIRIARYWFPSIVLANAA